MKKYSLFYIIVIFNFLFISSSFSQNLENGFLDATHIDCENKLIKFEGTCDFYWQEFLLPSSSSDSLEGHIKYTTKIPKPWTKIELSENNYCTADGYGTYRIRVKVKNKNEIYGLKINTVFSAYKLFVDGKLISSVGEIGKSREETKPKFSTSEIPLPVDAIQGLESQTLDIILQVANYSHRRAGAQRPIFFSTLDNIIHSTKTSLLIHLLLIGLIVVIGFNHVLMYVIRRLDIGNLLFGALATIMILRDITTGERIILHMFPDMDWELLVRLDNFSGFGTMTFFALYFYFTYKKDFPKSIFYFMIGLGLAITILVFSTDAWFYGKFRIVLEAYVGLGGLYFTFGVLLLATIRRRESAIYTFIGMFLLYSTAINDVLSSMGIIESAYIAPYGIAIFMLIQSFILTKKSAKALIGNKQLSLELHNEKLNLEERIEERTQTLTKQADQLQKYQDEQEQQNFINDGLNIIADVMRENKDDLSKLADQLLSTLIKQIQASMGALYLHTQIENEEKLKLLAHYGLTQEAKIDVLDVYEGLTGQCFELAKEMYIEDVTDKYFSISSGLGDSHPKVLALIPLKTDELVIGVIEIASLKPITKIQRAFLNKAIENIASQLNIVKINDQSKTLIEESNRLQEESLRQNKEMMENLTELKLAHEAAETKEKDIQEVLKKSKEKEMMMKAELDELNKQLENLQKGN